MARGGESNILGSIPVAKKRQAKKKTEKPDKKGVGNILFSSSRKPNNDIYAKKPTPLARRKAKEIALSLKKGDPLPLLLVLKNVDYQKGDSPAFDSIFHGIALESINKYVKRLGIKNSKEVRLEKKDLQDSLVSLMAENVLDIFTQDISTAEKAKAVKNSFSDVERLAIQSALRSQNEGPVSDAILAKMAMTPLEDLSEEDLLYISRARANDKEKAILKEISERQAVSLIRRNLPYNPHPNKNLEYAVLRRSRKGPSLLHLVENRKTLCGKYGSRRYAIKYGDWVEGARSGDYKQCLQCKKKADPGLLMRVESEQVNLGQDILPLEIQGEVRKIASDKKIAALIRKGLREGKKTYEISEDVDQCMIRRLARVTAKAADMSVSENPRGMVFDYGRTHILWSDVNTSLAFREELRGTGYRTPYDTRGQKQEDLLLHLTTAKERSDALLYRFLGNESSPSYHESEKWHKKSSLILDRAIRRAIRNKRKRDKRKKKTAGTLF